MSKRTQRTLLITALLISDGLAVVGALMLAYYLRIGSRLLPYTSSTDLSLYIKTSLLAVPLWLPILAATGLYNYDNLLGGPGEYAAVVRGCTYGVILLIILSFFERTSPLSRGWLLISWATAIITIGGMRFIIRRIAYRLRRRGWFIAPAVIVGANEQAKAIARQLCPPTSSGIEVVGFVDDFMPAGTPVLDDLEVLGTPRSLPELIARRHISELIVVPSAMAWESFQEILLANGKMYDGAKVRISPGFYELLTTGVHVSHKAFVPFVTPERVRITGIDALLKNLFDLTILLSSAPLWLALLGLLALLKKLSSAGPVLCRHKVLGQGGKPFAALTFCRNAPPGDGFAARLDRFLLDSGLYRLPQLLQVLSRRMSLIGPRPVPANPGHTDRHWLPNLLTVKPGITGPWVMAGSAWQLLEEERRLDSYYVRNWTIWLDFQILFRTIRIILRGK